MFSRLARPAFEIQKPLIVKHLPLNAVILRTSGTAKNASLPTESSKRDLINYPRLVRQEYSPPVRHLGVPESWFQFLYPRTGVTGPYMLFIGFSTFLFSKEIVLFEIVPPFLALCLVIVLARHKFGDKIAQLYNENFKMAEDEINEPQKAQKDSIIMGLENLHKSLYPQKILDEVAKAKKENVLFQMEDIYRKRLAEVYKKVKKQLDYQVEMENAERRITQKNLSDYVIRNVMNSITPELEKNTLQVCINNLNTLSVKK